MPPNFRGTLANQQSLGEVAFMAYRYKEGPSDYWWSHMSDEEKAVWEFVADTVVLAREMRRGDG